MKKLFISFVFALILGAVLAISASAYTFYYDGVKYNTDRTPADEVYIDGNQDRVGAIVDIPEQVYDEDNDKWFTVTHLYASAFKENQTIEIVKIPKTVKVIFDDVGGSGVFRGSNNLKEVIFKDPDESELERIPGWTFYQCPALTTVVLPNSVEIIEAAAFKECTSLCTDGKGFHLPDNLKTLGSNTGSGNGVFDHCTNLFFDSDILPLGLTTFVGEEFKHCKNLNETLVLTADNPQIGNAYLFGGDFTNFKNFVFLGKFDGDFKFAGFHNDNKSHTNIYFAQVTPEQAAQFPSPRTERIGIVYYCSAGLKGPKEGWYTKTADLQQMEDSDHLIGETVTQQVTCTQDGGTFTYSLCCEKVLSSNITEKAWGHNHVLHVEFEKGFDAEGLKYKKCENCGEEIEKAILEAIFIASGYSVAEDGSAAIIGGYEICLASLDLYEKANGTLEYGILFVNADSIKNDEKTISFVDGIIDVTGDKVKAIQVRTVNDKDDSEEENRYDRFNFKVKGFEKNESSKDIQLVISMYVLAGENLSFIQEAESEVYTEVTVTETTSGITLKALTLNSSYEANQKQ